MGKMTNTEKLLKDIGNHNAFNPAEEASVEAFRFFIKKFGKDIWTRDNLTGHVCASAWVVNKDRTKVLMAYHNTFKSFAWLGGHADGNKNLAEVAEKEALEETGLSQIKILNGGKVLDVDTHECLAHVKRGKPVAAHLHFNLTYLFEADENDAVAAKLDENAAVKWIDNKDILRIVTEEHMLPVYDRLLKKVERL